MKRILFLGLYVVLACLVVLSVEAGIGVEPSGLETMYPAGKQETGIFKITNTGEDAPLNATVEIQDWQKTGIDPATWLTIEPENYLIPSQETKEFKYTINIPKEGAAEYKAMVFFHSRAEKSTVAAGISVPVYVAVKERADVKAEITDYNVKYDVKEGFTGQITVDNKGNVHLRPFIRVFITNDQSEQVHYLNLPYGMPIQVGLTGKYEFPKDIFKLKPGTYTLTIECDYGLIYDLDKKVTKEVKIVVPKEDNK